MVIDILRLTNSFSQLDSGLGRMRSNGSLMWQNVAVSALKDGLGNILSFSTGGYRWTEGVRGGDHWFEQLRLNEDGHGRLVSSLDHPSLSDEQLLGIHHDGKSWTNDAEGVGLFKDGGEVLDSFHGVNLSDDLNLWFFT